MDILIGSTAGLLSGIVVGLLPGVNLTTILIIASPLLMNQSLEFCIAFYCVMSSVSQYFGSVSALVYGLPGENTSIPLLKIRDEIDRRNLRGQAFFLTSFGSLVASIIAGILLWLLAHWLAENVIYMKTYVILAFSLLGLTLAIFCSSNSIPRSIAYVCAGWFFSSIGYDPNTNDTFATFGIVELYAGLPTIPVILAIWAIPNLIAAIQATYTPMHIKSIIQSFSMPAIVARYTPTMIRASLIGFVSGLIPYVGTGISSYIAHSVEKRSDVLAQATAAETANNAANLSVLLPLLLLGVAIVQSEFLLLEILNASGKVVQWQHISTTFGSLMFWLAICNIIAFFVSWHALTWTNNHLTIRPILSMILLAMIGLIAYLGISVYSLPLYLTTAMIFAMIGYALRKDDLLPFTYAFLMQNSIIDTLYRVKEIYL